MGQILIKAFYALCAGVIAEWNCIICNSSLVSVTHKNRTSLLTYYKPILLRMIIFLQMKHQRGKQETAIHIYIEMVI